MIHGFYKTISSESVASTDKTLLKWRTWDLGHEKRYQCEKNQHSQRIHLTVFSFEIITHYTRRIWRLWDLRWKHLWCYEFSSARIKAKNHTRNVFDFLTFILIRRTNFLLTSQSRQEQKIRKKNRWGKIKFKE